MYIVFEGPDGVGKTTQAELLHARLTNSVLFSEPTRGYWGMKFRKAAMDFALPDRETQLEWLLLDRKDNLETRVQPALRDDKIVIQDRYYYSTAAYQASDETGIQDILNLNREFTIEPDVIFYLTYDKKPFREEVRDSFEVKSFQEKVVKAYESMYKTNQFLAPVCRIVINGNPKETCDEIYQYLLDNKFILEQS